MKIESERPLWEEREEELIGEAKIMQLLELSKTWVGDGMLYTMTTPNSFYYQPWKGEWYRE